jgi:hypothetical protein
LQRNDQFLNPTQKREQFLKIVLEELKRNVRPKKNRKSIKHETNKKVATGWSGCGRKMVQSQSTKNCSAL